MLSCGARLLFFSYQEALSLTWLRQRTDSVVLHCPCSTVHGQSTQHPCKVVVWIIWVCSENHLRGFLQLQSCLSWHFCWLMTVNIFYLNLLLQVCDFTYPGQKLAHSRQGTEPWAGVGRCCRGYLPPGGDGAEWQKRWSVPVTQSPSSAALLPLSGDVHNADWKFQPHNFQLYKFGELLKVSVLCFEKWRCCCCIQWLRVPTDSVWTVWSIHSTSAKVPILFILCMFHEDAWEEWRCVWWDILKMSKQLVYDKSQVY